MPLKGFFRSSTRAFWHEARQAKDFSWSGFLHSYIYGRWTYFYIAMGTGRHPLARRLAPLLNWIGGRIVTQTGSTAPAIKMEDTYHGKVVTLSAAKQLVSVKEDIALGDQEQIVPYALARDIVLKNPDHIVVLDCPCRTAKANPCLPLDVCLIVGEPFAGFVVQHHPDKARWITSERAQEILQAEDKRGHVHHAFFKDAMLGRFYAICNCCACCCGAMQAQRSGTPMLASSGYVAQVDADLCLKCGKCERTCQFQAIQVPNGAAPLALRGSAVVDAQACMGCGVCAGQCKPGAIQMLPMASKGMPLEIEALIEAAQSAAAR